MTVKPVLSLREITKQFNKGTANQNTVLNKLNLEVKKRRFYYNHRWKRCW